VKTLNTEVRRKAVVPFERTKEVSGTGTFSGYGSVFNVKDAYGDIVIPGAFAKSLADWKKKGKMPKMLWQHDTHEPIGPWTKMEEDETGLAVEGQILVDAGPLEKRAYAHLKAGTIDSLSIGYSIAPKGYEYDQEQDAFLLKQINLWEVSLVTFPANPDALIDSVKSVLDNPREFERFLRDAGLSRSQAKGLMSRGYDGLRDLREAEDGDLKEVMKSLQKSIDTMRELRAET
jgi:uncharacterized protein